MATKRQFSNDDNATKIKKMKTFDFSQHPRRKIAFQFFYLGWEYDGLVQQANTTNTVEQYLMEALLKTRLIEDWSNCNFSRCGRTDKGVSAFRQTASLVVRSCCTDDPAVFWEEKTSDEIKKRYVSKPELPYIKMLNGILPKNIRVFSWASVPIEFNARFDCNRRTYRYAFPKADLNLEKMRDAAVRLIGENDYSNFCQIDMNEKRLEQSNIRKIYDVTVEQVSRHAKNDIYSMVELTVSGSGFLWHMIRYIVTVLHEVGRGNEEPQLITDMLNIEKYSSRPHYTLASDTPLCLFDCEYKTEIDWNIDEQTMRAAIGVLQKQWATYQTRCRTMENMLEDLTDMLNPTSEQLNKSLHEFTQDRPIPPNYIKFEDRQRCDSIKLKREKFEALKAKKDSKE